MKIILFQSVDNLGSAGEVVNVKDGYYRNYLGPRGYARPATKSNLALMESQRRKIEARVSRERDAAKAAAGDLHGVSLTFELRANDRGQLFGSVTTTDVAKALTDKGYDIDRRKIELPGHIKNLGEFPARIRLYPGVYAEVGIVVERLLRPEEREAMEDEERRRQEADAAAAEKAFEPDDDEDEYDDEADS